jgi:Na+/H+ antiporter NhaD/arsenite permease-like protein
MPSGLAHVLLPLIVGISILLMLIRPRGIAEAWWIGTGVLILLALGLIPLKLAASAVAEGTDVYLFLIGMMLLSELAREGPSSIGSRRWRFAGLMAVVRASSSWSMAWARWSQSLCRTTLPRSF